MDTTTAVVCVVAMILAAGVITFALHRKTYVKAGGCYKNGEFYIEAKDRRR